MMELRSFVEGVAILMMPLGLAAIMLHRYQTQKAIGARVIQLTVVVMLIPAIVVLGLERILEPATIGTLVGALTGYVLSGVGDYRARTKGDAAAIPPPHA